MFENGIRQMDGWTEYGMEGGGSTDIVNDNNDNAFDERAVLGHHWTKAMLCDEG